MVDLSFDDLTTVVLKEKNRPALSDLQPDFFSNLLAMRDKFTTCFTGCGSPCSEAGRQAMEDMVKVTQLAERIYELRMNKVIDIARVSAIGDAPIDTHMMAPHEVVMFTTIAESIRQSKKKFFDLPPTASTSPPPPPPKTVTATIVAYNHPQPRPMDATDAECITAAVEAEVQAEILPAPKPSSVLVIAEKDLPAFTLPDGRMIKAKKGDFFSVPEMVAKVLQSKGGARLSGGNF